MDASEAAAFFRTIGGRLRSGAAKAMERSLDVVQERAEDLSSGTESTADLRRAGHPYARRDPNSAYPPEVINTQSHDFVSAWGQQGPNVSEDAVSGAVDNSDPKADLLAKGTRNMVARPLPEAVLAEVQPEIQEILFEELDKALRF